MEKLYKLEIIEKKVGVAGVIKIVNSILENGIKGGASDIHIGLYKNRSTLRYRIDGVLISIDNSGFEKSNKAEVLARIKILSNLNIAEKRLPQDGRMNFEFKNNIYDIRISHIPTVDGESLVLRIAGSKKIETDFEVLGFTGKNLEKLNELIQKKSGMILISGPTGSGKTTTLFSILETLNNENKKIVTIEDPVERKLDGATQIQVKESIGLSFLSGLKYILRHDPDLIVIGEVRDRETAEIAVKSALTGHLVLATIHTGDIFSTLSRLEDMGIPKYLILNSLSGIISQRLVRKLCDKCGGISCSECNNGYSSRVNINEIIIFNDEINSVFRENETITEIRKILLTKGFRTMYADADEKVKMKITDSKEIYRVLGEYNEKTDSL